MNIVIETDITLAGIMVVDYAAKKDAKISK